jgi:DNA repair exonuclease SbcCD nuclease subunit
MVRFLHTSDWQLGMTRHFLRPDAQARFGAARVETIRTIGRAAAEHGCSFVVVAGDVFESNLVDRGVILRALEAMREAQTRFYLLPGNHDPLDAGSVYASRVFRENQPPNVFVLDEAPVQVEHRVTIVGAPWLSKRASADPLEAAVGRAGDLDGVRIVVGHGAANTLVPDLDTGTLIDVATAEAAIAERSVQYIALGDRHSRTAVGSSGRIWYSSSPEPTDYDEDDPGWVLLVDANETACEVQPLRTSTWKFVRQGFELAGRGDIARVRTWLDGLPNKERTILKLSFVGALNLAGRAELDDVLAHHAEMFAAIEQWERHTDLVLLAEETDFSDLGLSGFAEAAAEELAAAAGGAGDHAVAARDALALLHRLSRGTA